MNSAILRRAALHLPRATVRYASSPSHGNTVEDGSSSKMPQHIKVGVGAIIAGQASFCAMLGLLDMPFPCGLACGWTLYSWYDLYKIVQECKKPRKSTE